MSWSWARRWLSSRRGNVTVIFALCAIPILFAIGGAVEVTAISNEKANLQSAVDTGALAGAGRFAMAGTQNDASDNAAVMIAKQAVAQARITSDVVYTTQIDSQAGTFTLDATATHKALIGFMGFGNATIHVTATAENLGRVPLCVLQTGMTKDASGIHIRDRSRISATACAVHANDDITVDGGAMIQAEQVQAVGLIKGPVSPQGHTGAMPIDDPFASISLSPPMACAGKPEDVRYEQDTTVTLAPGVHCEHYKLQRNSTLILQPGEHYFMDHLDAEDNAIIRGDDVVLIFGSTKAITFADKADVELGARKTGPFAGFLIVTSRDNTQKFTIASDRVSKLLGTIYIPNAELDVQTAGNVAQDSAWSIIVANNLSLSHNPNLVINAGYAGSGVPVPDGVGPNRNNPKLSR